MKHSNIKLLFIMRNNENIENNEYIFLISEDKYEYRLALYHYKFSSYSPYTLNKITHDLEYINQDSLLTKELNDIIKDSKNVENYKCFDDAEYRNNIITHSITHIRKLKIENIIQ